MRPVWLPSGHIPLREPPCPEGRLARAIALLLMMKETWSHADPMSRTRQACDRQVDAPVRPVGSALACNRSRSASSRALGLNEGLRPRGGDLIGLALVIDRSIARLGLWDGDDH